MDDIVEKRARRIMQQVSKLGIMPGSRPLIPELRKKIEDNIRKAIVDGRADARSTSETK